MKETRKKSLCPECGSSLEPGELECPSCRASVGRKTAEENVITIPHPRAQEEIVELDEEDEDFPRRRRSFRKEDTVEATDFLIPTNVSGWAILSCYFGLVGFCLPVAGFFFALPGFICGIVAVRRLRRGASYGAVTSNIRAILGLVLSTLGLLGWGTVLVLMILHP
jgi:hypothetical protein